MTTDSDKKLSKLTERDGMKVIFEVVIEGRKIPFHSQYSRSETARIMRERIRKILRQSR